MRFESQLCHVSESKVIVKVNAWNNDKNLGSALAESSTVELAEEKAIGRLNTRLNISKAEETKINQNKQNDINDPVKITLPTNELVENKKLNQEPSDWSEELTAIDAEIRRLKWSRDDEIIFLENNLGYKNRNKITNYNEIVKYLNLLKKIGNKEFYIENNEKVRSLIEETDLILRDLSWDYKKGREYLQKEFNVSTRKELDENQLLAFVEKLKLIKIQYNSQNAFRDDK